MTPAALFGPVLLCLLALLSPSIGTWHNDPYQTGYAIKGLRGIGAMVPLRHLTLMQHHELCKFTAHRGTDPELFLTQLEGCTIAEVDENNAMREALIGFAKTDGQCDSRQVEAFLLANKIETIHERNQPLVDYLNRHQQKFSNCYQTAKDRVLRSGRSVAEQNFDKFYTALQLAASADDAMLHERLRDVDLAEDELNFVATKAAIRETRRDFTAKSIVEFFEENCDHLRSLVGTHLDVINLSNAINNRAETDSRLLKLIEYDHACWYTRILLSMFEENVRERMGIWESIKGSLKGSLPFKSKRASS
jgi:hypothetical protein